MMRVFLFKSNARGMHYGVGTYIRTLIGALLVYPDVEVILVSYMCADIPEIQISQISTRQTNLSIPAPNQPFESGEESDKKYAAVVAHLLEPWLEGNHLAVFHFNSFNALPLMVRLKEKYPCPSVGVVHSALWQELLNGNRNMLEGLNISEPSTDVEYSLALEKKFYESCDRVVSVTRYMKDFLTGFYGIDSHKIDVIPNGIGPVDFVPLSPENKAGLKRALGFRAEDRILLFVGRIDESKGVFTLLDAFAEVCHMHESVRLVMAGEGQISECLHRNHLAKGRLCFTGFLLPDELEDYYRVADVGVVPSRYDHCPYTVLEMAAHKIPMIVSEIEGLIEIFTPEQCRFVDVDVSNLSNALREMLDELETPEASQRKCAHPLSDTFTSHSMGRSYRNLYEPLCALVKNLP